MGVKSPVADAAAVPASEIVASVCVPVWLARWIAAARTTASAAACAVETGLLASLVLSTLPRPTCALVTVWGFAVSVA